MSVVCVMAQSCSMSSVPPISKQDTFRRIRQIQTATIVWMTVEAAASLAAAWMARSPALLAFGGDSAIELFSAIVVLRRFREHADQEQSEKHAARIAAVLLFILAAYVAVVSVLTLVGYSEPKTTCFGIGILIAATAIMPWLAKEKRKLSAITGSAALRADAAESALCAYLALIALVGLGINAIWHIWWADPVAALVIVPLILWEGWEAMRGKACGCC
jgi:divalent metal cation (Fe/Co/Zn/Cd) transporter